MTDRVELRHDQGEDRDPRTAAGASWRTFRGVGGEADRGVTVVCPLCGDSATLRDPPSFPLRKDGTRGHDIAADGTVSPSIVCPTAGCSWHVWGRLLGWVPLP